MCTGFEIWWLVNIRKRLEEAGGKDLEVRGENVWYTG